MRRLWAGVIAGAALVAALLAAMVPARAQFDILTAPKTLIDRAIEARSLADIKRDNEIVLAVNKVMADLGTIKASTAIYEQRLLVTGVFEDKATYDRFEQGVRAVKGVKRLYWHVAYVPKADLEARQKAGTMIDWPAALAMETKGTGRLIGTAGVADVNFRIVADAFSTIYVLGRARSADERDKALARAKDGDGVKKVVNYIDVRP
ncbi:MAG TPA: BON domain-containing protein [Alphaproteobacteria bacterium]|jgi:osmotically-inducible protein OsmY|nr:BON domain-containing protein [Alphaproteobacteria bacterium]